MLILIIIWYIYIYTHFNRTCTLRFSTTLRNMLPGGTNCNVGSVVCEHFLLESIIRGSIQNSTLTNVNLIRYFYIKTFGIF